MSRPHRFAGGAADGGKRATGAPWTGAWRPGSPLASSRSIGTPRAVAGGAIASAVQLRKGARPRVTARTKTSLAPYAGGMWPFRGRSEVTQRSTPDPTRHRPPCFRSSDLPEGRSWESFRYLIEEREAPWAGEHFIDALVTDEQAERDRIVAHIVDGWHEARVTDRSTGEVTYADGSA